MKKVFKNVWLLPFLFIAVMSSCIMASCSDDKDKPASPEAMVGVWRWDFRGGYQLLTVEKGGKYQCTQFESNGGMWSETGTYSVKDNVVTTVSSDGYVSVFSVLTFSATTMVLRYEGEYVGQYPTPAEDEDLKVWTRVE